MELQTWCAAERGRAVRLARHLQITAPVVSDWCTGKKQVSLDQCVHIEQFTDRQVLCEELRPDKAAHFAYLRGTAQNEEPNQAPAHTQQAQAAITVIASTGSKTPAPAQNPPADAPPGAAGAGQQGSAWGGVERRHNPDQPCAMPDLERRAPLAAKLAGQGV